MEPPILGIDLGTTHSLVGIVDSGFPILLADAEGQRITPSAVAIPAPADSQEEPLVGARALRQAALTPERCFTSFKRFMGRRVDELEPEEADPRLVKLSEDRIGFRIEGEETVHTPEQLSAYLLIYLRSIAEKALERDDLTRAVITVPAYFNDAQRQATVRAGELAGLTVERILSEPTAAALAYGLDQLPDQSTVAVFDLGGGTFDISVLCLDEGLFRVKSTAGDTRLGGDDVDAAILGWIEEHLSHPVLDDQRTRIRREARAAKEALSDAEEVTLSFPFLSEEHHSSLTLSRTTFEGLWAPLLQRTRPLCLRALADAGLSSPKEELDAVILVGGSTRIPRVRSFVEDLFGHEPNLTQHPDEAVALGA
ncbi:MAG: Hsp70 family protein, partial [Verrucomicrobiota bacterium]